jgi:hypothetical protein
MPVNNATEVPVTITNIDFISNKKLTDTESKNISYDIQPQETSEFTISGNQIIITLKENFQKGNTYTITLKYNNKQIYRLTFETELFTPEQVLKEGSLQSQADKEFSDTYKNFIQKYPWYIKMPIENKNYRIVYDFDKKKFRIRILSSSATFDDVKTLVHEALVDLENAGVKEPIEYYVLDSNGNQL